MALKNQTVAICLALLTGFAFINGNVIKPHACGERVFVEDTYVVNAPLDENCAWEFQTHQDRILVFTINDGSFDQVQHLMTIQDGIEETAPILSAENQRTINLSRKDAPQAIYTTSSLAILRFRQSPSAKFQLKIQKAVNCPFNLGTESQCGRVVDDVSCYCTTFTKRNQPDQKSYCKKYGMSLLALETLQEEQAIHAAWFTEAYFWTSLTDDQKEGDWIWQSTNSSLYLGYSNWCSRQPDNSGVLQGEDCMHINYELSGCWNDQECEQEYDAICEAHP